MISLSAIVEYDLTVALLLALFACVLRAVVSVRPKNASSLALSKLERARTVRMLVSHGAMVGGILICNELGRSVFTSWVSAEDVSLRFVFSPIVSVMLLFMVYQTKKRSHIWIRWMFAGFSAGLLLAVWWALGLELEKSWWQGLIICTTLDTCANLAMICFWLVYGRRFELLEAARVTGIITAGGASANFLMGGVISILPQYMNNRHTLLLALMLFAVGYLVLHGLPMKVTSSEQKKNLDPEIPQQPKPHKKVVHLMITLSLLIVMTKIASTLSAYQLDRAMQEEFGSNDSLMLRLLGVTRCYSGAIALYIHFFVGPWLAIRKRLALSLMLYPLLLGSAAFTLLASGLLSMLVVMRAVEYSLKFSLNIPGMNIVYLHFQKARRQRTKIINDAIINPATEGIMALIIFVLPFHVDFLIWSWVLCIVCLLWLLALFDLQRLLRLSDTEPADDATVHVSLPES